MEKRCSVKDENSKMYKKDWDKIHADICETEKEVRSCIGYGKECIDCDNLITTKGQVIQFGNIKFLDYCPNCIKTCMNCNNHPNRKRWNKEKDDLEFICEDCFKKWS